MIGVDLLTGAKEFFRTQFIKQRGSTLAQNQESDEIAQVLNIDMVAAGQTIEALTNKR